MISKMTRDYTLSGYEITCVVVSYKYSRNTQAVVPDTSVNYICIQRSKWVLNDLQFVRNEVFMKSEQDKGPHCASIKYIDKNNKNTN